jgi:hypothetical protein
MMFPQATSHGNILTFTPPGFQQCLNVKFPDSRLAVCEKCKKNFKTRDMCRVRNTHTTAPWTTAYICLTLDESCTDSNGYIDKPFTVRMVQWQPYCIKNPFDPKTPVCAACKKTNRTRSFCRERHKHRQLPWCTVYVLLSALETADPSTVVAAPSKPVGDESPPGKMKEDDEEKEVGETKEDTTQLKNETSAQQTLPTDAAAQDEASAAESKNSESLDGMSENIKPDEGKKESGDEDGDDINDIAESRTFLAKVCCKATTIHWLDLADYEGNDGGTTLGHADPAAYGATPGMPVQPVDPNQAQYYHHAMGYAAQQHQNALKSHQQYFFQMQQRHQHHYAAQQAAWQSQYNQQPHMPMHGQPPPAPPGPIAEGPAPLPVTAGEAAAQQQRNRQMEEESQSPPPPPHSHGPPPGQQPHGQQQQQWMLYQQMYQAQLPPVAQPPPYPPTGGPGRPPEGGGGAPGVQGVMMPNDQQYNAPQTPEGNGKSSHEADNKRQRLV